MAASSIIRAMSSDSLLGDSGTIHVHRPALREIVADFRETTKTTNTSIISSFDHVQLSGQNFAMGLIGPKGGKLAFPDHSVEIDVPPGALTCLQVVYCCRIDEEGAGPSPTESGVVVFYSTILKLGATDKHFKQKVHLRFRHSAQFVGEEQKKQLEAFTQEEGAKLFHKEPSFDVAVDEKFVTLRVDHFCSLGVGADPQGPARLPPLRLLAMSFLVYVEVTKGQSTALNLLIGQDDESHMKCIRNLVARRWKVGESQIVRIDQEFKPFICDATSGLSFDFHPAHFQVQPTNRNFSSDDVGSTFLVENTLHRPTAAGFDPDSALCSVSVDETSNGRTRRLNLNIKWERHENMRFSQLDEKLFESRGEHAAVAERPIDPSPVEVEPAHKFQIKPVDQFAGKFHLDVSKLEPSSQKQPDS